jgi:hypothetical protein
MSDQFQGFRLSNAQRWINRNKTAFSVNSLQIRNFIMMIYHFCTDKYQITGFCAYIFSKDYHDFWTERLLLCVIKPKTMCYNVAM